MWLYGRILKTSYLDRVTNENVLRRLSRVTDLNNEIKNVMRVFCKLSLRERLGKHLVGTRGREGSLFF